MFIASIGTRLPLYSDSINESPSDLATIEAYFDDMTVGSVNSTPW